MTIIKYELKKLFSQQNFIWLCICLIVINLFLVFADISQSDSLSVKNYQIYNEVKDELPKDKINYLKEKLDFYNSVNEYEESLIVGFAFESEKVVFDQSFITEYNLFVTTDEYEQMYIYFDIYNNLYDYYINTHGYNDYVYEVLDNVDTYSSGILSKNMSLENKINLKKEGNLFNNLTNIELKDTNYLGFDLFISSNSSTILMILVIILLIINSFYIDDNTHMDTLIKITNNGRKKTAIGKIVAILLIAIALQIIFIITSLIMYQIVFGLIDFRAPIQSIPLLYNSPYKLLISEYIVIVTIIKIFAITTITSLFIMIYKVCKYKVITILIYMIIIGVSLLMYMNIQTVDHNNVLKFINIFTLLNANELLMFYKGYILLGVYQPLTIWVSVIFCLITMISFILYLCFYSKNYERKITFKTINLSKLYANTNLLVHESYKLLITNKTLLIVLCLLFTQLYFYNESRLATYQIDHEDNVSEAYNIYGGYMDEVKFAEFERHNEYYTLKDLEMDVISQKYSNNEIDDLQYSDAIENYLNDTKGKSMFLQVYSAYEGQEHLVYTKGYRAIFSFNTSAREVRSTIFLMLSIIVLLFSIYTSDYKSGDKSIYDITKKGRLCKMNKRIIISVISCTLLILVYSLIEFIFFNTIYPMNNWQAPLNSIMDSQDVFKTLPQFLLNYPIYFYYICVLLTRIIGGISAGLIVTCISYFNKKSIFSIGIAVSILILPMLLYLMGLDVITFVSIFDLIMGSQFLMYSFSFIKLLGIIAIDVILIVILKKNIGK